MCLNWHLSKRRLFRTNKLLTAETSKTRCAQLTNSMPRIFVLMVGQLINNFTKIILLVFLHISFSNNNFPHLYARKGMFFFEAESYCRVWKILFFTYLLWTVPWNMPTLGWNSRVLIWSQPESVINFQKLSALAILCTPSLLPEI